MAKGSPLIFSPTSLGDLQRINRFYSGIDAKVRGQAFARLAESFRLLEDYPNIGRPTDKPGIQEFIVPFGKGNFFIRYRLRKNQIQIAHIWHSLEDEG